MYTSKNFFEFNSIHEYLFIVKMRQGVQTPWMPWMQWDYWGGGGVCFYYKSCQHTHKKRTTTSNIFRQASNIERLHHRELLVHYLRQFMLLGMLTQSVLCTELGPSRFFSVQVKSQVSIFNFKSSHKSMDHCIAKSQVLDLILKSLIK